MAQAPFAKIEAATAAQVCARFDLTPAAKRLLNDKISPGEFVTVLVGEQNLVAAIDFLAHALPPREGVWWGCLCMQHALGDKLTEPDRAAATAVVRWVMEPSEENRAAAKPTADAAGPLSVAGTLARATSLTGGSIQPPGMPFKPPPPFAAAKAIAKAVRLASIKTAPAKIPKMQQSFVTLGTQIAEGKLM